MLVQHKCFQGVPQHLARVTDVALFVFVICSLISISAMQTAYILALVAWITRLYLQGNQARLHFPLLVPFGGFTLASALATITAVEPYRSLIELRNVLEASLFYLVLNHVTTEERATTLARVLIATGTLMALYGLSQSVAQGMGFRIHGTMSIYMTFAGLLMLVTLMALAQLLYSWHRREVVWGLPTFLLLTAALLLTQTRSAWLGLAVGCCVILGLWKKICLLVLPLSVLAVLLLAPQVVKARALSILDRRDVTAQERLSMWDSGFRIVCDYPWTGVGMGAMSQVYQQYRHPQSPVDPGRRLGHLHNNMIQVAAERGLLGLVFWIWLWVAYFYRTWLIYRSVGTAHVRAKGLVVGSLASVAAFHVEGLFEHTFGDAEVITLVYFLMALPFVVQYTCVSRRVSTL